MTLLKQNTTHKAVQDGNRINIYIKGFVIDEGQPDEYRAEDEFLFWMPLEDKDDLLPLFEHFDEENRINVAEANAAFSKVYLNDKPVSICQIKFTPNLFGR